MMFQTSHIHTAGTLIALLVVALVTSCSPRPKEVLSATEMENVLYDLHRAEGIMYVKGYEYGHHDKTEKYYEVVLQKHGITQAQFDSSLVWYTDNPTRFNKIYPKVIERLTQEKDALAALNEQLRKGNEETTPTDTIAPVKEHSLDEWMQILREGLPMEWGLDSIVVDTAFVYPYLTSIQDSIQQVLHPKASAVKDSVVTPTPTQPAKEKKEKKSTSISSSKHDKPLMPRKTIIKQASKKVD